MDDMNTKSELRLGVADHGVKLTYEEFGEVQNEKPWRYERVQRQAGCYESSGPRSPPCCAVSAAGSPNRNWDLATHTPPRCCPDWKFLWKRSS